MKDKKLDKNKIKNSLKNNYSSGTNGIHNNNNNNNDNNNNNNDNNNAIPLTKDHYMSIGEPRGKKSDDNPRGYSKSQNKLFNALVIIHNKPTNDNNNIRNNNDININGPFHHQHHIRMVILRQVLPWLHLVEMDLHQNQQRYFPRKSSMTLLTFQIHLLLVALPQLIYHHLHLDLLMIISNLLE